MTSKQRDRISYLEDRVRQANKFYASVGGLRALKDLQEAEKMLVKAQKRVGDNV